jgi:hypothetical protein
VLELDIRTLFSHFSSLSWSSNTHSTRLGVVRVSVLLISL